MLLGYSFEPRPNSCALATAGSIVTSGLSTSCRCSQSTKNKLTSPKDGLQRPQRLDVIHAEPPFSPLHQSRRRVSVKAGSGSGSGPGSGPGPGSVFFLMNAVLRLSFF